MGNNLADERPHVKLTIVSYRISPIYPPGRVVSMNCPSLLTTDLSGPDAKTQPLNQP